MDGQGDAIPMSVVRKLQTLFEDIHASGVIPKEGNNKEQNYKYLSERQIKELIQPLLVKHKLLLLPIRQRIVATGSSPKGTQRLTDIEVDVRWIDVESGEWLPCTFIATGADSNDKGVYKALTGGGKQFICNTFWIPTGDDPERGDGSGEGKPRVTARSERKQEPDSLITDAQVKRLHALARAAGLPGERAKSILASYEYTSATDIKVKDYDKICREINPNAAE